MQPSIQVGESSSAATPILDVFTTIGNPPASIDVVSLQFQVYDVSSPAKKVNPVQVYPGTPGNWQTVDPTATYDPSLHPTGVRLGVGHYFAPWVVSLGEALGDHLVAWRYQEVVSGALLTASRGFSVVGSPVGPDPSLYCTVADVRAEGFVDQTVYPDARILSLIALKSRYVDKATGRWFYPKAFPLGSPPALPQTTISSLSNGLSLPQSTINVASTIGFSVSGTVAGGTIRVVTDAGVQVVSYAGLNVAGNAFLGCTGGTGLMSTGGAVMSGIVYPAVNLLPGLAYPIPTQINLQEGDRPLMVNGQGSRDLVSCELEIPICRLDALGFENQAFLFSQITWMELSAVRVFNRHLRGMTQPDDRENPHIGFTVAGRIIETIASSLYPAPRIFPRGRMNVFLFGAFGYTDPDPTGAVPEGITPLLIQHATKLLVIRDLLPESKRAKKLAFQNMHRIIQDHEGSTSIGLQQNHLKGGFSGDPEIDGILMAFKRPFRMGVA